MTAGARQRTWTCLHACSDIPLVAGGGHSIGSLCRLVCVELTRETNPECVEEACASLVMYAARLNRAVVRDTATDVPAATLRLLSQLDELAPIGVSQLAKADSCSQPTMSCAVRHLVDKGWAAKTPNPRDARGSLVHLTDAGVRVLDQARRGNGGAIADRLDADPCHGLADIEAAVVLLRHLLQTPDRGSS